MSLFFSNNSHLYIWRLGLPHTFWGERHFSSSNIFLVLGIKLLFLHMISKCFTTELHTQPSIVNIIWVADKTAPLMSTTQKLINADTK